MFAAEITASMQYIDQLLNYRGIPADIEQSLQIAKTQLQKNQSTSNVFKEAIKNELWLKAAPDNQKAWEIALCGCLENQQKILFRYVGQLLLQSTQHPRIQESLQRAKVLLQQKQSAVYVLQTARNEEIWKYATTDQQAGWRTALEWCHNEASKLDTDHVPSLKQLNEVAESVTVQQTPRPTCTEEVDAEAKARQSLAKDELEQWQPLAEAKDRQSLVEAEAKARQSLAKDELEQWQPLAEAKDRQSLVEAEAKARQSLAKDELEQWQPLAEAKDRQSLVEAEAKARQSLAKDELEQWQPLAEAKDRQSLVEAEAKARQSLAKDELEQWQPLAEAKDRQSLVEAEAKARQSLAKDELEQWQPLAATAAEPNNDSKQYAHNNIDEKQRHWFLRFIPGAIQIANFFSWLCSFLPRYTQTS